MAAPDAAVRHAAEIARNLAAQARRAGEPGHAAYFDGVAAMADLCATRLSVIRRAHPGLGAMERAAPTLRTGTLAARR